MAVKSETVANVSVAVMALAVVVLVASQVLKPAPKSAVGNPYKVGELFDLPIEASIEKSDKTIVLFLQSQCHFCAESMPFYRRLLAERAAGRATFHLVTVSLDPLAIAKAYLAENGIETDELVRYPPIRNLRIGGTPTLLVVDRSKQVLGVWTGRLPSGQEEAVRRALTVEGPGL